MAKAKANRVKFTEEDDDKIIGFVELHPALFDARDPKYRDSMLKSKLWLELAGQLNKDGKLKLFLELLNHIVLPCEIATAVENFFEMIANISTINIRSSSCTRKWY